MVVCVRVFFFKTKWNINAIHTFFAANFFSSFLCFDFFLFVVVFVHFMFANTENANRTNSKEKNKTQQKRIGKNLCFCFIVTIDKQTKLYFDMKNGETSRIRAQKSAHINSKRAYKCSEKQVFEMLLAQGWRICGKKWTATAQNEN